MAKAEDLTGQKFGRLTVLERAPNIVYNSGKSVTAWLCQCDCGNTKIIASKHLKNKNSTKSCGCLAIENGRQVGKKYGKINGHKKIKKINKYDLSGDYGIGYTYNTSNEGINYFYFDLEDYDKIKNYSWHFHNKKTSKYSYIEARSYSINKKSTHIRLHRFIMNCPDNMIVDHINHKTYDNRKQNLRIVTSIKNIWNHTPKTKYGVSGITYKEKRKIYEVCIGVNYKKIYLGLFKTIEEAIQARKNGEIKYYGEYRYQETI